MSSLEEVDRAIDTDPNVAHLYEKSSITEAAVKPSSPTSSLNLFRIPHSRMKELVSWPLKEAAAVPDVQDLEPSLQAVYEAMWEVKSHEYIENHFIMDRLKARLQSRQVTQK